MLFLELVPENKRAFLKQIVENDALTSDEKDLVLRPNMSLEAWNEYQKWKQSKVIKARLPFLMNAKDVAEESVILELVHNKSMSDEARDSLLRKLLSEEDFERYLEWKPTNVAKSPDSFLRLLDDSLRSMVERRLKVHDMTAVDVCMMKVAPEEARKEYEAWKKQLETTTRSSAVSFTSSSSSEVALPNFTTTDVNSNTVSTVTPYQHLMSQLQKTREDMKSAIAAVREKTATMRQVPSTARPAAFNSYQAMQMHMAESQNAVLGLSHLIQNCNKAGGGSKFSAEIATPLTVPATPVYENHEETADTCDKLRQMVVEDAVSTYVANEKLARNQKKDDDKTE